MAAHIASYHSTILCYDTLRDSTVLVRFSDLSQDSFHQKSQQLNRQSTSSNPPQSSSKNVSSVFQKSKPQQLMSRLKYFTKKIFPSSSSSSTIQLPLAESVALPRQEPSQQIRLPSPDEKLERQKVFISELYKITREVAANHNDDRSIIPISKVLWEGNDLEVTVAAGSYFDEVRIRMESSDTQNDIHAVTSFVKSMLTRVGSLGLSLCGINSNQFLSFKEAIKSMPGSIRWLHLHDNLLPVNDVIEVLHKIEKEVRMWRSLDDGDGRRKRLNIKERSKLQEALDRLDNKALKIWD